MFQINLKKSEKGRVTGCGRLQEKYQATVVWPGFMVLLV